MRKLLGISGILLSLGIMLFNTSGASAAVTNCSSGTGTNSSGNVYAWTRCNSTDGNPPYTTQYRALIQCVEGGLLAGPWRSVGSGLRSTTPACSSAAYTARYYQVR
jgi:hypothetical protein